VKELAEAWEVSMNALNGLAFGARRGAA